MVVHVEYEVLAHDGEPDQLFTKQGRWARRAPPMLSAHQKMMISELENLDVVLNPKVAW